MGLPVLLRAAFYGLFAVNLLFLLITALARQVRCFLSFFVRLLLSFFRKKRICARAEDDLARTALHVFSRRQVFKQNDAARSLFPLLALCFLHF